MNSAGKPASVAVPAVAANERTNGGNFPYRIALRNDDKGALDDVVVCDVSMFRAEMMDNKTLWMCCYFPDSDQRITFWIRSRRGPLDFDVTEEPSESERFTFEPESKP